MDTMPRALSGYLALGDSYTIGEGVPRPDCWPVQLAQALRARGAAVGEPQIVATTGWTTDELAHAIDRTPLQPPYRLVSLLIGVNNQYRGRSAGEYRGQFAQLLQRAVALAGGWTSHVLVVSIPDWGVSTFAEGRDRARIAAELDDFNAIARDESGRAGARWIDISGLSRALPHLLVADGLHPDGEQYRLWTQAILPPALTALRPDAGR